MPKSSKKKKEKNVDFTKAKLKLGKGKQVANNATDTSFKARSIAIPHQTIGQEKNASKPTTRRNLTLDELLIHLKHYNPNTRKDAILGLRELLEAHPRLMETSLTPIVQTCARIVGDEDAEVRKTLLNLLGWLFRLIPLHKIRPHTPLLILFITSAQTHIFPAIRIDAIKFLDLLLELTPDTVTQGWHEAENTGTRVLEGYLGLLNAGSSFWTGSKDDGPAPSTSSVTLSSNSKLVVLSSLASFLQNSVSQSATKSASSFFPWYMESCFSSSAGFISFCRLIYPSHSALTDDPILDIEWSPIAKEFSEDFIGSFAGAGNMINDGGFSLDQLGDISHSIETFANSSSPDYQTNPNSSRIARLAHTLHPILVSTWLDAAPAVFAVGTPGGELEAQLVTSVAQIALCLYGALFRDTSLPPSVRSLAFDDLSALLGYMSTYLPRISESGDAEDEEFSRDLSLSYCQLISLAALASRQSPRQITSKSQGLAKTKQNRALSTQIERVGEYLIGALNGELKSASHPLGYSLSASAYSTLLPTIWLLLGSDARSEDGSISERICLSCVNHAIRTSSKSGTKSLATHFVGLLVLLYIRRDGVFESFPASTAINEGFKEWYHQLPKVLWEVGGSDLVLTETILRLLLRISQRQTKFFDATTKTSVVSRLSPYFAAVHPEKGLILGPFTKIKREQRLRRVALEVMVAIARDADNPEADSLKKAVDLAVKDTDDAHYWNLLLL